MSYGTKMITVVEAKRPQVEAYAIEVFSSRDKAARWMREPNPALHGRRPVDLLDTEKGLQDVEDVLTRIESGTFS